MMTLEWLRRHDEKLELQMRKYLFTNRPLPLPLPEGDERAAASAESSESAAFAASAGAGTLGIGSLRGSASQWGGL
jgi:hypothetical protein